MNCACSPCNAHPFDVALTQFFWSAPKPEINMASSVTSLSSASDGKGQGVNLALLIIERKCVTLEEKQMEILRIAIVEKKDAVLQAGFGKSLVPKLLMALFADFMDNSGFRPTETKSIVLFVSPLNALIR